MTNYDKKLYRIEERFPALQRYASHLSQSDADTAEPKPQWPSIESQLEYWKTHDHGGNVLPSRIDANTEQYP